MNDVILEIIRNNPWIVWPLLCIIVALVIVLIVLAINASFRGRRVKAGPIVIEGEQKISEEITPSQVFNINPVQLTEDQVLQITDILFEKMQELEQGYEEEPLDLVYYPPELPEIVIRFFKIKVQIENKLRNILISQGGSWAGISLADGKDLLQIASENNLIGEKLVNDISFFLWEIRPYMAGQDPFDDTSLHIDAIAPRIIEELEKVESQLNGE